MSLRTTTPRLLRPLPRTTPTIPRCTKRLQRQFFTLPTANQTQTLTASRILPHPLQPLYALIADVDSYHTFVPYCTRSVVTHWDSSTTPNLPRQADLHVGWGGISEVFTSRLHCVPGVSVEAISGEAAASGTGGSESSEDGVFKSLTTKWSVEEAGSRGTKVDLRICYEFKNPLYAAVSAAVSDKVAGVMIEAFEKQARERLGKKDS